jgi:ribosomal protein S16
MLQGEFYGNVGTFSISGDNKNRALSVKHKNYQYWLIVGSTPTHLANFIQCLLLIQTFFLHLHIVKH